MKELKPGLTIGIPTYNEEAGLSACLNSCLDQKAVILISDNGSTDQTPRICKDFAERHPSTRVFSHSVNRGSLWNFGHLLERCETEYFMWLGAHDCLVGDFGELAVKALQDYPQVGFCAPRYRYISPGGQPAGEEMDWEPIITDSRPWHRFKRFLQIVDRFTLIHSVFRVRILREAWKATCTDLERTPGPDLLIMSWILLREAGNFQAALEYCRVLAKNPEAGDYQKKIYATGAKKNLSPKDTGKRMIHIAENCRNLTWVQKKATVYLVAQKWGRPRGNHPVQLAIYLFSEGKKKIGPLGRRLNNRLFGISGKSRVSHIQDPRVLSRKDVIEKISRPNCPVAFGKIGTTELLTMEYHYRR
ncbi:MAG: glycosyltransferase family 2 protein, partial [Verrucomicrobia bacterium]|nr:glycosyltransferase family 2 protein [Verrucomicrobiota bacterium]